MNPKEFDKLMNIVYNESMYIQNAIEMISVSENSTKRERYCRKWNLTYSEFLNAVKNAKGQLLDYPVQMCCMEHIIIENRGRKNKYLKLLGSVVEAFRDLFNKSEKKQNAATEMENLLKSLKEKPDEEKKTPPSLSDNQM